MSTVMPVDQGVNWLKWYQRFKCDEKQQPYIKFAALINGLGSIW